MHDLISMDDFLYNLILVSFCILKILLKIIYFFIFFLLLQINIFFDVFRSF